MNKISAAFENKKAFIAYLMAGDPSLEASARYILAMQEAGADLIEVGIPFSDPIAEGEVIQEANVRALTGKATLEGVFDMLDSIKDRVTVPLVFLTYVNPVFVYGYERFFKKCQSIGVCGAVIPDLPYEEQAEAKAIAAANGVDIITMVAPTSQDRAVRMAKDAKGFIYLVSSMGVTGVRSQITTDIPAMVKTVRQYTDTPIAVGFGISTPAQAAEYSAVADGVIVGSAIVKNIAQHGLQAEVPLKEYVREMKNRTK